MSAEPLLAVRGLVVRYRSTVAVAGVDLAVAAGEVIGLIGPDGAGKTSTLRVLGGLMRASAGTVTAFGADTWATRRALHCRLGYLAQRFALYGDLTVDENVQFFALMYGVPHWRERRTELLEVVGLAPFRTRIADRLSGGMKQKLALACTLIHGPEILLLDEPTTGVDPVTRRELWRLLADLVASGLTLVVATPYLDEAERCTRVVLLHHGRVLADDRPAAIPARLPGTVVEVTSPTRPAALAALRSAPEVIDVAVFATTIHVRLDHATDPLAAVAARLAAAGVVVTDLKVVRPCLEDAFLHLTQVSATSSTEAA